MPDSIRKQVVDAVDTRLATITTANGYQTNLGNNVNQWRDIEAKPFQDSELPALNWRDIRVTTEQQPSRIQAHRMEIECDLIVKGGSTTPANVREMIADIYKCIGVDRFWGGVAFQTEPVSDEIHIEHGSKRIGGARIQFAILYRTLSFDPYTQA